MQQIIKERQLQNIDRELKQPWQWRQQELHKFTCLRMKKMSFPCLARAFFIFKYAADILVLSASWNGPFCSCVDNINKFWQSLNFAFQSLKRWFHFNSRIVRTHFASVMTLNNWEMIAEMQSYIFRLRSRCRRRRVCLSSLKFPENSPYFTLQIMPQETCGTTPWLKGGQKHKGYYYDFFSWCLLNVFAKWAERWHLSVECKSFST